MYVPYALAKQAEIETAVHEVERILAPDVVRIRYHIGQDWSDDWGIFFRIVLTDDAARQRLRETRNKIVGSLAERLDFFAMGVFPYHNFRSVSEQAELQEEAWA